MLEYVISDTEPVAPEMVLIRTAFSELLTVECSMVTFLTTLLERSPTEPMERPWPPMQVPPVNQMFYRISI